MTLFSNNNYYFNAEEKKNFFFSRARWRENRTIFNTPNPRLMNASLLQHNQSFHEGRRGSRASVRGPSRAPSVMSLAPHSPSGSLRKHNFYFRYISKALNENLYHYFAGSRNGGPRSRCNSKEESLPEVKSPTKDLKNSPPEHKTVKVETQSEQTKA